jgi:hypothetical protein
MFKDKGKPDIGYLFLLVGILLLISNVLKFFHS